MRRFLTTDTRFPRLTMAAVILGSLIVPALIERFL